MKPSVALNLHREALRALIAKYPAANPRVFGSVVHGDDTEESDLDLVIDMVPGITLLSLSGLQGEAERLLGVRVDLLTPGSLPAKKRESILKEAVPL
jgi:predicted nucleotidyltransferase